MKLATPTITDRDAIDNWAYDVDLLTTLMDGEGIDVTADQTRLALAKVNWQRMDRDVVEDLRLALRESAFSLGMLAEGDSPDYHLPRLLAAGYTFLPLEYQGGPAYLAMQEDEPLIIINEESAVEAIAAAV